MKDYEKLAIGVAVAGLGFAAYQAHKTKQAVDATEATDPSRNPITAAIDLSTSAIGGVTDWFSQRFDDATGYTKGRTEDVINTVKAVAYSPFYAISKVKDFGRDATEAGSKYVWNKLGDVRRSGKIKINPLTNKPFTLMGAIVVSDELKRRLPKFVDDIQGLRTSVGSKVVETTKKSKRWLGYIPKPNLGKLGIDLRAKLPRIGSNKFIGGIMPSWMKR